MLPDETIEEIAKDIVANKLTTRELADKYDVKIDQIHSIINKDRRKDILDKYDFSHFDKYVLSEPVRLDAEIKAEMERLIKEENQIKKFVKNSDLKILHRLKMLLSI